MLGLEKAAGGKARPAPHRAACRLVRALMERFKHSSVKDQAELSPPHASAVP